jgi:hypothetical protein
MKPYRTSFPLKNSPTGHCIDIINKMNNALNYPLIFLVVLIWLKLADFAEYQLREEMPSGILVALKRLVNHFN